jgi:hypothetical protein
MSPRAPRRSSTFFAAASVTARLEPTGSSCEMENSVCPLWSMKLVFSRPASPIVTKKTRMLTPTVIQRVARLRVTRLMIGT